MAALLVRVADEGAKVALVLLALDRAGSAAIGGLLVAALLIPHVIAAPAVGWLTDRARRPELVLTGAAVGFGVALAAAAVLLDRVPLPVVLAVLVAGGCCGPALTGGLTSQLSTVVEEGRLPRGFGADSMSYNLSGIAGPAVAGMLSGLWGPTVATFTLAGVAAVGAVALVALPVPPHTTGAEDWLDSPPLSTGATAIVRDRVLRTVTIASSLGQLGPGGLAVVAAVLATQQHRPAATGWLLTAMAVGGLLGSLWWTWRPAAPARAARTVTTALLGIGVPLGLAAATTQSLAATAVLFAVSGLFLGPFTGALFTVRQAHAPTDARAQVFTISAGMKTTAAAAGAALAGTIAHLPLSHQLLMVASSPILAGALGGLALTIRGGERRPQTCRIGEAPPGRHDSRVECSTSGPQTSTAHNPQPPTHVRLRDSQQAATLPAPRQRRPGVAPRSSGCPLPRPHAASQQSADDPQR